MALRNSGIDSKAPLAPHLAVSLRLTGALGVWILGLRPRLNDLRRSRQIKTLAQR
jgi:hypothetical protein